MSPYRKNILVGLTAMVALILLGWMILQFGAKAARPFAQAQLPIRFLAERADGLFEGSPVLYRGVNVGQIGSIRLDPKESKVVIDAVLNPAPPLPANVVGVIKSQGVISAGVSIDLELTGPVPEGQLTANTVLPARYTGMGLIPPEFAELAKELQATARQLRETNMVGNLNGAIVSTQKQIEKVGNLVQSLQELVGDPKMRQDLQVAFGNIRTASDNATRIAQNLEQFSGKLNTLGDQASGTLTKTQAQIDKVSTDLDERLRQIAALLDNFEDITKKLSQGQGTAGMLINDPKLYQGLVDTTRQLNDTIADLKRLVSQWEQEGITFKLGK
jgi:phospholipid/cholesterol/gamma-HCH transport system substrate-binding protein